MEEILNSLNNQFCGCTHVTGSIQIDMFGFDGYTNLNENSFNFLYHVEEISGVLWLRNIPTVNRIVLPNLRIIRGEKLIRTAEGRGLALVLLNTRIGALILPNLTEVTRGDVRFQNTTSSMCNYRTVNWNDIIDNGQLVELLACNIPRPEGEEMTCRCISIAIPLIIISYIHASHSSASYTTSGIAKEISMGSYSVDFHVTIVLMLVEITCMPAL